MDVGNVKDLLSDQKPEASSGRNSTAAAANPKNASALTSTVVSASAEPVSVELEQPRRNNKQLELQSRANDMINVVNVTVEATNEIDKLIKSIDGIAEQAQNSSDSSRVSVLEQEANQLVNEISKRVKETSDTTVAALPSGDNSLDVEDRLNEALRKLLPQDKGTLGLGTLKFSPVENIINIRETVAAARQLVDEVRQSVGNVQKDVVSSVNALDVAAQNSEASQSSIRDLDAAFKLANDMSSGIATHPDEAFAVNKFSSRLLSLINS